MDGPLRSEDDFFERLRDADIAKEQKRRQAEIKQRMAAQEERAQQRAVESLSNNLTLPVTISSIRITGANYTRRSFLARIFGPIVRASEEGPYTLGEAIRDLGAGTGKLERLDIFKSPIDLYLDKPKTNTNGPPTDFEAVISVAEKGRLQLKTGTDIGNVEGSAHADVLCRNIFGGAESLNLNAALGTRTRSSYTGTFATPLLSNPDARLEISGLASATQKPWASHEEVLRGGLAKLRFAHKTGIHEFGYEGLWRQLTGLSGSASPSIRKDAGDTFKSALTHTWTRDTRSSPLLPTNGTLLRTTTELAGFGPLRGDVAFLKSTVDTSLALSLPPPPTLLSFLKGTTFTTSFRTGLLYPLSLAKDSSPQPSRVQDRFILGGPTDVRGFRIAGLGPRDGADAVGGDVFAAASANVLFPLPRLGPSSPLRFQGFVNGGRLLGINELAKGGEKISGTSVQQGVLNTVKELGNGLPSLSAGVGLVYAHPMARFEVNFSLPLVLRQGEEGRKGVQFGIGISFL
ncbi:MAG: hypothetical protein M1814_000237 [Vezdaea aestivalis]|nr:MAG: hypothetical protein M1814_000237 [Vezdaea aestivalis]